MEKKEEECKVSCGSTTPLVQQKTRSWRFKKRIVPLSLMPSCMPAPIWGSSEQGTDLFCLFLKLTYGPGTHRAMGTL